MQNKNQLDMFHVNLTFYEEREAADIRKAVKTEHYGSFSTSNIRFVEPPRRKVRYLEFKMSQKQTENIQRILERVSTAIEEVMEDYK